MLAEISAATFGVSATLEIFARSLLQPVGVTVLKGITHGDLSSALLLARLMARELADAEHPQALVPVPLHRDRLRRRGYDQALELARPLAQALGLPLRDDLLRRMRATAPQSRLAAPQRRRNLRGAFAVRTEGNLPTHVALVDDVMTTGATVEAAAAALRRAGVARVDVWVCARVP